MKLKYLIYLFLANVFMSCGTASVMVNVQRPADISVPQSVQKVIIANRSIAGEGNKVDNILEGLFSGEGIGADKKGSQYCMMGLTNMLQNSERYILKNSGEIVLNGTGTSKFPPILDWTEVKSLCNSYGADALIVLSTFDSDNIIIEAKSNIVTRTIKGAKVKEVRYPVTMILEIESGWRIYDLTTQKIVDVNTFTEVKEFSRWGSSYDDARSKLPSKRSALKDAGVFSGERYAYRITPKWIRVNRTYFIGNGDQFKIAKKYVERGDWDNAIEIWKPITKNMDDKVARRAYFNLALAAEIKGSYTTAIEYAQKAEYMGEKIATTYIRTLKQRIIDEEKLEQQLNN